MKVMMQEVKQSFLQHSIQKKEYAVASDMGWYVRVPKEYFEDGLKESWGYFGKNTRWAI